MSKGNGSGAEKVRVTYLLRDVRVVLINLQNENNARAFGIIENKLVWSDSPMHEALSKAGDNRRIRKLCRELGVTAAQLDSWREEYRKLLQPKSKELSLL